MTYLLFLLSQHHSIIVTTISCTLVWYMMFPSMWYQTSWFPGTTSLSVCIWDSLLWRHRRQRQLFKTLFVFILIYINKDPTPLQSSCTEGDKAETMFCTFRVHLNSFAGLSSSLTTTLVDGLTLASLLSCKTHTFMYQHLLLNSCDQFCKRAVRKRPHLAQSWLV